MPPRDVKPKRVVRKAPIGPPAPKKKAVRVSAGPAGPIGPPVSKRVVRQRLAAQYTHRGPVKTSPEFVRADTPTPKIGPKRPGRLYARIKTQGPLGNTGHQLRDVKTGMVFTPIKGGPGYKASGLDAAVKSVATPVLKDYIDINANAIPATYHLAATAATGHPGKAAKMLAEPYVQAVKHPVQSFKEHPLGTALLLAGPKAVVGRGAGRVMRLSPKGSTLERAASLERAPKTVAGTTLKQERLYSPDVIDKTVQVAGERVQARRVRKLKAKAQRATDPEHAAELRIQAERQSPTRMGEHEIRRRVTERFDANEVQRRQDRARVTRRVDEALPKKGKEAVPLVAQGITKADPVDLASYRSEIAANAPKRPARARANLQLQRQIKGAEKAPDMGAVSKAAESYRGITEPLTDKLVDYGMLKREQADMAKLTPYAVRHMGAKFDKATKKIVGPEGHELTPAAIRAHMAETGTPEPAYVTQAPGMRGARNYFIAQHEAPNLRTRQRTGQATRQGTFDAHPDVLREGAARMQGLVSAHEGYGRFVDEFSRRKADGEVHTFDSHTKAADHAADLAAQTRMEWRPIRLKPFAASGKQLQALLDETHPENQASTVALSKALEDAVTAEKGPGPWALVPRSAADEAFQHIRVLGAGGGGKAMQAVSGAFRKTVLATSFKWLFGNVAEAGLRSAVARAGPRSYITGRRIVKRLEQVDPKAAQEFKARALGGGHYTMADRMPKRTAEQFAGTRLEPLARGLGAFWRAPGPKQVADVWHGWTEFVFHRVNEPIEKRFQTAMAGAEARRTLMGKHVVKLANGAIDDAANGLRNTETQVRFARAVDDMYGRYSKFSPAERRWRALYTPFMAWTLNAVNFATRVLPRDHPVLTSLIASAHQASEEWRKEHGLDKFMKGAAPGFLQGSIPVGSSKLRVSRYTPFGAYSDLPGTLAGTVLPQLDGSLAALKGQDWKGKELRGPDGQPLDDIGKMSEAAKQFALSTIPIVGQVERVAAERKGPLAERLRSEFDPSKTVAPPKKKVKRKGGLVYGPGTSGSKLVYGSGSGASKLNYGSP